MSSLVQSAVLPSAFSLNEQGIWTLNRSLFSQVELSSTDPQIVIYTLNPQAVWADGSPITADDLIANWESGKLSNLPTAAGYRAIASLQPSGHPGLVVARFSVAYSDWRTLFADLLPASILKRGSKGCTLPSAEIDVSGGPFAIDHVDAHEVRLVRNPRWWGDPVALDRLIITRAPSATTAVELVAHGRAQVATVTHFSTQDVLRASQSTRTTVAVGQSASMLQLVANVRSGTLAHVALRQLIAASLDRFAIGQQVVGQSTTNVGVLSSVLFAGVSADERGFDTDPATRPTPVKPLSPEIAASVGALGYSFHHGRWSDEAGHQLAVRIGVDASLPYAKILVRTLFAQLNLAGIGSVFVREPGENGAARALRAGNLDAALVVRVAPQAPSQEASWFTSAPPGGANAENPGGYSNPSVDVLFSQASRELNPVDATDSYGAIDALVAADAAVIPLVSLPYLQVWRTRLNGVSVLPYGGSVTQNAGRWTFVAPMAATVSTK